MGRGEARNRTANRRCELYRASTTAWGVVFLVGDIASSKIAGHLLETWPGVAFVSLDWSNGHPASGHSSFTAQRVAANAAPRHGVRSQSMQSPHAMRAKTLFPLSLALHLSGGRCFVAESYFRWFLARSSSRTLRTASSPSPIADAAFCADACRDRARCSVAVSSRSPLGFLHSIRESDIPGSLSKCSCRIPGVFEKHSQRTLEALSQRVYDLYTPRGIVQADSNATPAPPNRHWKLPPRNSMY